MPSLRNRDELRAPRKFDDPEEETRKVSYQEPDVNEEVYRLSPPRSSQTKYRGPVIQFNPNLSPAAFPTLDPLGVAHDQQVKPFELESNSSYPSTESGGGHDRPKASADVRGTILQGSHDQSGSNDRNSQFRDQDHRVENVIRSPIITPPTDITTDSPGATSPDRSTMGRNEFCHARGLLPQHHDGTEGAILQDNMRRMRAAGQLTDHERNVLEMVSSDEEEAPEGPQPSREVRWNDLATPLKLQLYDIVSDAYSDLESINRLRLNESEVGELKDLVLARQRRVQKETDEGAAHRSQVHESLLRGALMSEEKYREIANRDLFQHVQEEDKHYDVGYLSETGDVRKAKAYLIYCRLPSNLLDRAWASIPRANALALGHHKSSIPSAVTIAQHELTRSDRADRVEYLPSPLKYPFMRGGRGWQSPSYRSPGDQPSPSRQSSGFIRPSIELGTSTVVEPRRPQMGDFVHRPISSRREHPGARKAAAEANTAARDLQVTKAPGNHPATSVAIRQGAPPSAEQCQLRPKACPPSTVRTAAEATTRSAIPTGVKRRASQDLETSFLNSERRPGARQPKLTEKAVDAELASQTTATVRKKARTSGGSIKKDTEAPETTTPRDSPHRAVEDTSKGDESPAATAMMRNDSAIDLTADDEIPDGANLAKDTPNEP